ncbi:MAG: hypothetical protein G01um101470_356 [Parcubacteria group bacterium Gr01-1014_70]|nr:MAG: hypothetical protein G01um101470_356 [Parcubacteria group bacterium Gr01-1014_70]
MKERKEWNELWNLFYRFGKRLDLKEKGARLFAIEGVALVARLTPHRVKGHI